MANVFTYQAALLCEDCGNATRATLTIAGKAPANPADESSYDSDHFPKGPYPDGGGEGVPDVLAVWADFYGMEAAALFGSQFGRRDITLGGHALARVSASPVRGSDGIAHYPLAYLLGPADVGDFGGLIIEALNAYPPALAWAREMLKKV